MKQDTLAAVSLIHQRYGTRPWQHRDVADLLPSGQVTVLRTHHMIEKVAWGRPKYSPTVWRLSPAGVEVARVPAIRESGGRIRRLSTSEMGAVAAWRAVGDRPFLRRDLPAGIEPAAIGREYAAPVGDASHVAPNALIWQLTPEGVALGQRVDALLLALQQSDPPRQQPAPPPPPTEAEQEAALASRRAAHRARCLAYYHAHRDEINARKRAKYAAEKQKREGSPAPKSASA